MIDMQEAMPSPQKNNVFQNPLANSKAIMKKRISLMHRKNMRRGYSYIMMSAFFLAAYGVSFLYPQVKLFLNAPGEIQKIQEEVNYYDNTVLPDLINRKNLHEADYSREYKNFEQSLDQVFPPDIDKLGIIKRLENFATETNAQYPPFELNAISLGQLEETDNYTILPISTSIRSSTANFDRFLKLINLSGHIESSIPIRLMEISNISISYQGVNPTTGEDNGVNFSVKLNAYSRPQ